MSLLFARQKTALKMLLLSRKELKSNIIALCNRSLLFNLEKVQITDPDVIAKSGEDVHSIIHYSGNPEDQIPGVVFKVSLEELLEADKYEVADYKRIQVELFSGKSAWVYVSVNSDTISD